MSDNVKLCYSKITSKYDPTTKQWYDEESWWPIPDEEIKSYPKKPNPVECPHCGHRVWLHWDAKDSIWILSIGDKA